jgi:hypothetical protein
MADGAIAERPEIESAARLLHRETGDDRWLDPSYARRMAGPTMAARHLAAQRSGKRIAEAKRRRADPAFVYLKRMLCSARKNASRKGVACTLTEDELWALLGASGGRCAVTGVTFSLDRHRAGRSRLAPSMDRIDDAAGYVSGNVRLVCQIANLAMNVWDADTLLDFIQQARGHGGVSAGSAPG